jgi:hypothetical protein
LPRRKNRSRRRRNRFRCCGSRSWYPILFFIGHLQSLERMPNTMPGDLEVSRPLCLCPIGMDVHMPTQGFPVQLARPLRAGAFVRHTARLEPAIDAGLAHLESPSRLGLAATAPDKLHHPLAQI